MRFFQIVCLSLALTLGNAGITTFAQNGNNYFLHTVSRGQSLYSIANMYHVSIDDIVRLNPASDSCTINQRLLHYLIYCSTYPNI